MREERVTERVKIYDRKCPGLTSASPPPGPRSCHSSSPTGETSKRRTTWLGLYNSETFTVEHARSRVYALRGTGAVAIADTAERKSVVAQSRLVCS
jgi:hypothetical protein